MRVVIANPEEEARIAEIEPGLESLQAVVGGWIELWAVDGAASIHVGQSAWVSGWEFDRLYLKRCRRVSAEAVPVNWHRALDRYAEKEVAS